MPGAADTARLIAQLEFDNRKFDPGVNHALAGIGKLESKFDTLGSRAKKGLGTAANNLKNIGLVAGAIAGTAAVAGISKSINAASDLAETQSKVTVVFGESAKEILEFGKTSATALGQSETAALSAAATYGNLFVSMGLGADKSADMSKALVTLASDLASFNNIDPTEAAEKLRAGLTGESEPLKSLGININETIIKAKALELGLVQTGASTADITLKTRAWNEAQAEAVAASKKYGAQSDQALKATVKADKAQAALEATTKKIPGTLDAATKAQAAYALIFEQSATAQGDFARTSGGLANQQRILRAQLDNTAATIGTAVLPSITKVVVKLNDLLTQNQPAIAEFAKALPPVFEAIFETVSRIPWEQVGTALQIGGTGARLILEAFLAMPPWVQTAVITGWGLNKLTGGALSGIVGELGKGLIKGVLGMNAGIVNINAAAVKGPGLIGDVGPAATGGGLGALLLKGVFPATVILGIGTAIGSVIVDALGGQLTEAEKDGTGRVVGKLGDVEVVLGQSYAAQVRAEDERRRHPQPVVDNSPDARQARSDLHRVAQEALEEHRRGERGIERVTALQSAVVAMEHQLHADLENAITALNTAKDPAAIAAAVTAALTAIKGGAGSAGTTKGVVSDLEAQLKAAEAANNKPLADQIKAAIAQIEPFQKGRQWQAEQIAKAREIASSIKPLGQKTTELKAIQQDLLSHQRTMAAEIVGGLREVVIAIDSMPLRFPGPISNESSGAFVPRGDRPGAPRVTPKNISGSPDDRDLAVTVNANVTLSTRDVKTAQVIRSRMGATPVEAGSA